ncbi:MAG: hypothetical protein WDM84_01590 [Bauldia sp.]
MVKVTRESFSFAISPHTMCHEKESVRGRSAISTMPVSGAPLPSGFTKVTGEPTRQSDSTRVPYQ